MLSSKTYDLLKMAILEFKNDHKRELWDLSHPYAVCIHRPTRFARLLNRQYKHIIDISEYVTPVEYVKFIPNFICYCTNRGPALVNSYDQTDFDSYWLFQEIKSF